MKTLRVATLLALSACVQVSDRTPDSARAKIDTSSGLLATTPARVDSTPASTVPRTPPLIGPDSTVTTRRTDSTARTPVPEGDAAVPGNTPPAPAAPPVAPSAVAPSAVTPTAAAPATTATGPDLDVLRRSMQVPVAGITPATLHDTYDEMRGGTRRHEALDIPAARGTPVLSATNGRVLRLFNSKAGGLMVYATDSTERFILLYGHLDAYQPGLAAGQSLRRGQQVGIVGTTGNAPPGVPHLHFAILRSVNVKDWWKGTPVNPYPLLKR